MAFQMIPPRVSSSPPPLDSLPTVTCPGEEEDDDEFGDFSTHNSSFDITGLSDKLPPTPDASPSKFPGFGGGSSGKALSVVVEGMREDTISQDSGLGSANHPNEFSPQPQPDGRIFEDFSSGVPDVSKTTGNKPSHAMGSKNDQSSNNFADFQSFDSTATEQEPQSSGSSIVVNKETDGYVDNGLSSTSSQTGDPLSFAMSGTPPPLDRVADTTVLDDDFTRLSPSLPPSDADEFGDFASVEFCIGVSKGAPHQTNVEDQVSHAESKETKASCSEETIGEGCQPSKLKSASVIDNVRKQSEIISEDSDSLTPDDWHSVNSGDSINDAKVLTNVESDTVLNHSLTDSKGASPVEGALDSKHENCIRTTELCENDLDDDNDASSSVCANNNFDDCCVDSSASLAVQEEGSEVTCSITTKNNQLDDTRSNVLNKEAVCSDSFESRKVEEDSDFGEFAGPGFVESASNNNSSLDVRTGIADEYKAQNNLSEEAGADADDDFGGFVIHKADDENDFDFSDFHKSKPDDDEDDLDFGDLRARVESGMFEADESPSADDEFGDFGTFASAAEAKIDAAVDEDEFGDFGASADDFGDFDGAGGVEDDFGDFSAPTNMTEFGKAIEFEDQFGDFSATGDNFGAAEAEKTGVGGFGDFSAWKSSSFEPADDSNPVLRKLENLVLKWIPKHKTSSPPSGDVNPVPSLHQAVESDAFVWHHLENLEGSAALKLSWGNTQAHNLFLSSVNVDARNILFGQKWSSSVPLFARTLSFSPLTPAKSSEGGSSGLPVGISSARSGPTTPPITSLAPAASNKHPLEDSPPSEIASPKDGNAEEQIPPAKFDWTSSGLTNPLEGPAYNSSLFDLDLLLTNSSIGKGATNALLASLEREFLSEGGEKGTSGRMKSPPTPSPLVQQILGGGMNKASSATTPLQSLAPEVRLVVEQLPDLGFMRSRVLMFPIRGEQ
ncbi:aftiphilin-like isoform X2 [Penaeus japonicus]|uniref:aftiphilin-like isoform X2 n=1 Tax=Penaeus japonicus TaxID=27405 RepID=UPI001C717B21|nr:aftiphilin-like isoform X2 [Penaeus japonicus]